MTIAVDVDGSYDAFAHHGLEWQHNRMANVKWDESIDDASSHM